MGGFEALKTLFVRALWLFHICLGVAAAQVRDVGEPRHIAAYYGYGTDEAVWVRGRLLANRPYGGPQEDDGWWDNLRATYLRWESDEVPGARIRLTYAGESIAVTTDDEGYYHASFARSTEFPATRYVTAEHEVDGRLLTSNHWILLPEHPPEYVVISDMDDTVIETGITQLLLSARLTFLHNARTRTPLAGVGSLYRALRDGIANGKKNPILYVSNSAWNMFDLLRDFLELNDIPRGPLLLRDIGLRDVVGKSTEHKLTTARRIIDRFAPAPVVLIGDSGQHDAEIYAILSTEYTDRIRAVYIRDVDPGDDSEYDLGVDSVIETNRALGIPFLRVASSAEIAIHAAEIGLIPASTVAGIRRDVEKDRDRESLGETVASGLPE